LDLEESEQQPLETSLGDLCLDNKEELNKVPSQEYDITVSFLDEMISCFIMEYSYAIQLEFIFASRDSSRYCSNSSSSRYNL
jgi:hypothetical protein